MTSIFEGQPAKTRPNFQSKQGSFGFQDDTAPVIGVFIEIFDENSYALFFSVKNSWEPKGTPPNATPPKK